MRESRTPTLSHSLAAALSGTVIAACFLRFQLFPLAWVAFVPLLWALTRATSYREAARIGLVAGLVTNLPAFYWLVYTIHVFGGFPYPIAAFFYACLSLLTAQQFVLFALALHRSGPGPLGLSAPLLWVALEFLYPNMFPWRMGHSQWHVPVLLQIGDLTGPYGLSFVMLWVSSSIALWSAGVRTAAPVVPASNQQGVGGRRDLAGWKPSLIAAGTATGAIIAYGLVRLPQVEHAMQTAPAARVALVQGNVGIKEKGDISYFDINLEKYRELSAGVQDEADVIVWPETVSQHWVPTDAIRIDAKENPFQDLRTHLIFGGLAFHVTGLRQADEFNSAFLMSPGGVLLGRYDKRILMPFGEYIPLGSLFPAIYSLSPETGHFTPGPQVSVFNVDGKLKVGQLICYEDLDSNMPRHTTQAGAEVLLNILNDAWYGDSAAPYQHQALALWRAVENRRYLLRGSNSGVTSIIDAAGRVVAQGGLFTAEVVSGAVPRLHLSTIYTQYGDVFAWLIVLGALLCLTVPSFRR